MLTGIFPGSFNPIHIGHLALANWICEFGGVDEMWFLVSPHNPLKKESELMNEQVRLEQVQASIQGYPKFKASDFEFHLPRPSYTINTLQALKDTYPDRQFALIIGADSWVNLPQWKDYEKIISDFHLIVYPRRGYRITIPKQYVNVRKVKAPLFEISSSFIRDAIKEGKNIRFFLPEAIRSQF